jgi:hypothetical protein
MQIFYTVFYQFRIINMEYNDRNSCTHLNKVWLSMCRFLVSRIIYFIAFHTPEHCLIFPLTFAWNRCQLVAEVYKT